MDDVKSRILAAAMGMMQPFGGLLAFFTIDSLGRRPLMTWSAGAMAVCMATSSFEMAVVSRRTLPRILFELEGVMHASRPAGDGRSLLFRETYETNFLFPSWW